MWICYVIKFTFKVKHWLYNDLKFLICLEFIFAKISRHILMKIPMMDIWLTLDGEYKKIYIYIDYIFY